MNKQEALRQAIQNEIKSRNLYSMLAGVFKSSDAESAFESLATLERAHEKKLTDLFVREYPSADLAVDQQAYPTFKSGKGLKDPVEIIRFAITKEEQSHDRYLELIEMADDPDVKVMFHAFAEEETHHKEMLETEITRIQGNMTWFDTSELHGFMEG
jgi:rubrerythrin